MLVNLVACMGHDHTGPNHDPILETVRVTPAVVWRGSTGTITANASDPEGDLLFFEYQPEDGSAPGYGPTAPFTPGTRVGPLRIRVRVRVRGKKTLEITARGGA